MAWFGQHPVELSSTARDVGPGSMFPRDDNRVLMFPSTIPLSHTISCIQSHSSWAGVRKFRKSSEMIVIDSTREICEEFSTRVVDSRRLEQLLGRRFEMPTSRNEEREQRTRLFMFCSELQ